MNSDVSTNSAVLSENSKLKTMIDELNQKISNKNQIFAKVEKINKDLESDNVAIKKKLT